MDLLERMLMFNPNKRITVADCIMHPYFEDYDQLEDSDTCEVMFRIMQPFDWAVDNIDLKK
jgi:mitogen-activated protein kinase 1/3